MADKFEFPSEVIKQRFVDHLAVAEEFCSNFEEDFNVTLTINKRRLYLAIVSTYKDIERYKNFHLIDPHKDKSDSVKRSAYLIKWICRFKPISIVSSEDDLADLEKQELDYPSLVNEFLAIHIAQMHLSVGSKRDFLLSDERQYDLVYDLLYRYINEDALIYLFQTIVEHVQERPIVVIY